MGHAGPNALPREGNRKFYENPSLYPDVVTCTAHPCGRPIHQHRFQRARRLDATVTTAPPFHAVSRQLGTGIPRATSTTASRAR